jgi:hypothetical protein
MISPVDHYRKMALDAREQAVASSLPQVKLRYLRSAEHFDQLAATMETIAQAKSRNDAARENAIF